MIDTLDELRDRIRWEAPYVGRKPYSHSVVRIILYEIEKKFGRDEANRAVRDFKLEGKGFNAGIIDGVQHIRPQVGRIGQQNGAHCRERCPGGCAAGKNGHQTTGRNCMNINIRESLERLRQLHAADLASIDSELTTLLTALRKEVESQTNVVNAADSTDSAYSAAARNLAGLLQLTQAVADSKKELDRLVFSAGKVVGRVLKKAPK